MLIELNYNEALTNIKYRLTKIANLVDSKNNFYNNVFLQKNTRIFLLIYITFIEKKME